LPKGYEAGMPVGVCQQGSCAIVLSVSFKGSGVMSGTGSYLEIFSKIRLWRAKSMKIKIPS